MINEIILASKSGVRKKILEQNKINCIVEASNIPPNWHSWIHFIKDKLPGSNQKKYFWEKKHVSNLTGTNKAYRPKTIIESKTIKKKYETWKI